MRARLRRQGWRIAGIAGAILLQSLFLAIPASATATAGLVIRTLSNRADLISGEDALIEVVLLPGTDVAGVRVDINGQDATAAFAVRPDGRYYGLVTGLQVGQNLVTARVSDGSGASLVVTDYPIGGPIFAGPQVQPWVCRTSNNGLGPALDAQCNAPTTFAYQYKSSTSGSFSAYNPSSPPSDVATTTTDQGLTVPYVVRVETGAQDREIYKIAVLFNPSQGWTPWSPQPVWNHKVLWPFGGGTEPSHVQGAPSGVINDQALGRGFMVANSGGNVHGQNLNHQVSAEAIMMLKEHIIEQYGSIRYVIGNGGSGGAIQQRIIATNYPGLLDGIQPSQTFQDTWTTYREMGDCYLLVRYYNANMTMWADPAQQAEVNGHPSVGTCSTMSGRAPDYFNPSSAACGLPAAQVYNASTNPGGARCDAADYVSAMFGTYADGRAKRPFDNGGLQYGLDALLAGEITPAQFVDLNSNIGCINLDFQPTAARCQGDPDAVRITYSAGEALNGRGLASVPAIDTGGTELTGEHYYFRPYVVIARMNRDAGTHASDVLWDHFSGDTFTPLDTWLHGIESDNRSVPLAQKVVDDKPSSLVDGCWAGSQEIPDPNSAGCRAAYPVNQDTRVAAGEPMTSDIMKCHLRPVDRADYSSAVPAFTEAQFQALAAAFPTGVCDYRVPGVNQVQPAGSWQTFAGGPGGVPLGPAPTSTPVPGVQVPDLKVPALALMVGACLGLAAMQRRRRRATLEQSAG